MLFTLYSVWIETYSAIEHAEGHSLDLSKIQKASYSSPGSDKTRIIFLLVITAIVIAAFFYFKILSQQQQQDVKIASDDYVNAPPPRVEVYARVEPEKLVEIRDTAISERVVKEKEPFLHLIKQASKLIPGDMEILGVESADLEAIRRDPAAFRGKPLQIKGNLQWFESEEFQNFQLFRGYMTTLQGEYVYFTVLHMPDEIQMGDVFKLQGFFFKIYSFILPGEENRVSDAVFLVGRRLIQYFYRMDPVTEIDMDLLESIYDYTLEASSKEFQEKPLYHLLSYVQNMDDETYQSIEFSEHLADEVMLKASDFRGKALDIVGQPVWLRERLLGPEGENPLGIDKIYRGIVLNYKGGFCYFFALDIPDWLTIDYKDLVHLKGFFLRNYSYTTRQGKPQSAPTLIVRGFDKYVYPEDNTMAYITLFIFGLTLLIIGFFFFTVYKDRKSNRLYRARFIEKKKQQLQKAMGKSSPTPPLPGPSNLILCADLSKASSARMSADQKCEEIYPEQKSLHFPSVLCRK